MSYTSKISTEDARIRWGLPTHLVDRHIRAMTPTPGAWTMLGETRLKIGGATPLIPAIAQQLANSGAALAPGQLFFTGKYVLVGTVTGAIQLATIQAPGKKMMNAADWARGAHLRGDEVMQ